MAARGLGVFANPCSLEYRHVGSVFAPQENDATGTISVTYKSERAA
jgi:hypothetical protein